MAPPIVLRSVERARVTTLMDNVSDLLLASSEVVERPPFRADTLVDEPLVAEHGYAALVELDTAETTYRLLLDAGLSRDGVVRNLDRLGVILDGLDTLVLSHGHSDHTKGLASILERLTTRPVYLHVHPDALLERKLCLPSGVETRLPPPSRGQLERRNVRIIERSGPSTLFGDHLLLTGEIPRDTAFEQGMPTHYTLRDGTWEPDPLVRDDQALVFEIRDRGLVVLTGCGHAGIVNTIEHARRLTGVETVHAIIGGLHLGGPHFEPFIEPTVDRLVAIDPAMIVAGHCTGWKATQEIATRMPKAYVPNSVGSTYIL